MQRILVTGAGGYVGIPLCKALLDAGHSVVGLDRYFFGKQKMTDSAVASNPSFTMAIDDIRYCDVTCLNGIDTVIDLAGISNDASAEIDPDLTRQINCDGAIRFAKAAKAAGVHRYVYSSSASVYGQGAKKHLTETDNCRPQTLYAESKLCVEQALREMQSREFEIVILRNATIFGFAPRMRFDLAVNIMTLRAWKDRVIYVMGGGAQWRPFIHIKDVVRAIQLAMSAPTESVAGETFNVGADDMNYQIRQLAHFVLDVVPNVMIHRIPDNPDTRTYHLSFAKIRRRLDFEPTIRVHEGIVEIKQALERGDISGDDPTSYTLQWYRSLLDWDRRIKDLAIDGRLFQCA
jgi:nucleoside-diphosphate-sugar epimerase